MQSLISPRLFIISIFLFGFLCAYSVKAEEQKEYECPSVANAALDSGYTLKASGDDIWELTKKNEGLFYVIENMEVCSYQIFANILNLDIEMSEFINKWHKDKFVGKIYRNDNGYVYEHFVVLPNASNQLLEINIEMFNRSASKLLDSINNHITSISNPKSDVKSNSDAGWFKAYILACAGAEDSCMILEDTFGPYKTYTECLERTRKMVNGAKDILGEGEFSFKCEDSV